MAIAAMIRPNDCLIGPKTNRNPNPYPYLRRKKRSLTNSPAKITTNSSAKSLMIGKVNILKRGEDLLSSTPPRPENLRICSTEPDKMVVYAGAGMFVASPPPSSLPFPAFCRQKEENSAAACDIRRLLGLDSIRRL